MGYTISWIHIFKRLPARCIRFVDGKKVHFRLRQEQIADFLSSTDPNKMHILFLDGVVKEQVEIEKICFAWMDNDLEKRPLVIAASMTAATQFSDDERRITNYRIFRLCSWSFQDYQESIKNPQFSEQIEAELDAHVDVTAMPDRPGSKRATPDSHLTCEEKLESKSYFAGGSSRAMFDMITHELIERTQEHVSKAQGLFSYLSGEISECSDIAVNHSISWHAVAGSLPRCTPVSTYAALAIAQKLGPQLVSNLRQALLPVMNPSIDGLCLKCGFLQSLESKD
jgi:hypothetical protein